MLEKFEKYLYQTVFPLRPPETIYHYTTQKGILGIIPTRTMWATQAHFLNDRNEVFLTFKLLERELRRMVAESQKDTVQIWVWFNLEIVEFWHVVTCPDFVDCFLFVEWSSFSLCGKNKDQGYYDCYVFFHFYEVFEL